MLIGSDLALMKLSKPVLNGKDCTDILLQSGERIEVPSLP